MAKPLASLLVIVRLQFLGRQCSKLKRDPGFGPASASLGALSFKLHDGLADEYDGKTKWGYSRSTASSMMVSSGDKAKTADWSSNGGSHAQDAPRGIGNDDAVQGPAWLSQRPGDQTENLGEEGSVAQVDPLRLSQFLLQQSIGKGVRLHQPAKAVRVSKNDAGEMSGIRVRHSNGTDHRIPCTRLLITAGAWTPRVFSTLFPASKIKIGVQQLAGHSLVVKSPRWTKEMEKKGCHAVFTTMKNGTSPEIFSRVGEEIYIAGINDPSTPLPELSTDATIDKTSIGQLNEISERLLGTGTDKTDLEVVRESICFRPVTRRGVPILSRIEDKDLGGIKTKPGADGGVFIAAGHGPWGISQGIGTGKVMAEMVEGLKLSADVSMLSLE